MSKIGQLILELEESGIDPDNIHDEYDLMCEKLSPEERINFGLPDQKKFPMPDPQHVRTAISYFKKAKDSDRLELAKNIIKYIKHFGMKINVNPETEFGKLYYQLTAA